MLDAPDEFVAGVRRHISATITNHGPSDIDAFRLVVDVDDWEAEFTPLPDDAICGFGPTAAWTCVYDQAMASGGGHIVSIEVTPPADASGGCAIGAISGSDLQDPVLENSFDVAGCWVSRRVDLGIHFASGVIIREQGEWQVEFVVTNAGPSLAQRFAVSAKLGPAMDLRTRCWGQHSGSCLSNGEADVFPGGRVEFRALIPDSVFEHNGWDLVITATARPGEETSPLDNTARLQYRNYIFESGFEF